MPDLVREDKVLDVANGALGDRGWPNWVLGLSVLLATMTGCNSSEVMSPTAPPLRASSEPEHVSSAYTITTTEILRPDGNSVWDQWMGVVDSNEDGDYCSSGDCCLSPCDDSWRAVDESQEDAVEHLDAIYARAPDRIHRLSFQAPSGSHDLVVNRIVLTLAKNTFNPSYWSQTLTVTLFVDGSPIGSDSYTCRFWEDCASSFVEWSPSFDNLSLTWDQINTLELELEAKGDLDPLHSLDVYHVEAAIVGSQSAGIYRLPGAQIDMAPEVLADALKSRNKDPVH